MLRLKHQCPKTNQIQTQVSPWLQLFVMLVITLIWKYQSGFQLFTLCAELPCSGTCAKPSDNRARQWFAQWMFTHIFQIFFFIFDQSYLTATFSAVSQGAWNTKWVLQECPLLWFGRCARPKAWFREVPSEDHPAPTSSPPFTKQTLLTRYLSILSLQCETPW
jgi:hypothetical protein